MIIIKQQNIIAIIVLNWVSNQNNVAQLTHAVGATELVGDASTDADAQLVGQIALEAATTRCRLVALGAR